MNDNKNILTDKFGNNTEVADEKGNLIDIIDTEDECIKLDIETEEQNQEQILDECLPELLSNSGSVFAHVESVLPIGLVSEGYDTKTDKVEVESKIDDSGLHTVNVFQANDTSIDDILPPVDPEPPLEPPEPPRPEPPVPPIEPPIPPVEPPPDDDVPDDKDCEQINGSTPNGASNGDNNANNPNANNGAGDGNQGQGCGNMLGEQPEIPPQVDV